MEVHFVHADASGGLAVIGVFIVPGKANRVFNKIVSTMPKGEGPPIPADPDINPTNLLPAEQAYYHYEGSLTTPPCSQTVDWIVFTHHIEAAETDIERFAKLYPMNARPLQELDRRFILTSGPG
jgi:carbonic anhydrase